MFRILRAVSKLRKLAQTAPSKFERYNTDLVTRGYPKLVNVKYPPEQPAVYTWNKAYTLHSWGLVFPSFVQFQIRLHTNQGPLEMQRQYLFPIDEIWD